MNRSKEKLMEKPNYMILGESEDCVVIRDIGPWHKHMTVTNGAEQVVAELAPVLRGRRLEYYDSEGRRDQILVENGRFAGFAPAARSEA
jgi:predicted RNA-binding protein with PUA domain